MAECIYCGCWMHEDIIEVHEYLHREDMLHIESAGWNRRGRRRPQAVSRPHRDSPTDSSPSDSPPPDSPPPPPPSQLREPSPERWGIGYPPVQGTERDSADSIAGLPVNVHSGASSSLTSGHDNLPGRGNQRSVGLSDRVLTTKETGGSEKRMSGTGHSDQRQPTTKKLEHLNRRMNTIRSNVSGTPTKNRNVELAGVTGTKKPFTLNPLAEPFDPKKGRSDTERSTQPKDTFVGRKNANSVPGNGTAQTTMGRQNPREVRIETPTASTDKTKKKKRKSRSQRKKAANIAAMQSSAT